MKFPTAPYQTLKGSIESVWPQWKIDWYNSVMATSSHATKLHSRSSNFKSSTCPSCGAIAEYNAYYNRMTCTRCSWEGPAVEESKGGILGDFKIAHLLGIAREHESRFRQIEIELTKAGYICFAPAIYDLEIYNQHKDMIEAMCYEKLKVCDFCVLVTPEHVGRSTTRRIQQAIELGKPVYTWEDNKLKNYNPESLFDVSDVFEYADASNGDIYINPLFGDLWVFHDGEFHKINKDYSIDAHDPSGFLKIGHMTPLEE